MTAAFIAVVLLRKPVRFEKADVKALVSDLPPRSLPFLHNFDDAGDKISIHLDDQAFAILATDQPVPRSDVAHELDRPGNEALAEAFDSHTAHLLVVCRLPAAEMGVALMAATGVHLLAHRLGALGDPVAVTWASSMRTERWDTFADLTAPLIRVYDNEPAFPSRYWVSIQITQDSKKFGGETKGLNPLTGYKLSMTPVDWPIEDVAARLVGIVQYLMENGPVLEDGQTFGASEEERFRIALDGEVMRLELEGQG
ncbi:DUF4261 domain-containing protein [Sagittula sp. SSi028]|uniref:DUF4261 domain-containing protein n=1 Tax=Sagittula sp. SSi028 TaxID=3400636 RepID=UPI003AF5ECF2